MSYRKNDSQKSAVYLWEKKVGSRFGISKFEPTLTLDECQELVNKIWKDQGRNDCAPLIKCGEQYNVAFSRNEKYRKEIHLPLWARNPLVVIHEVTHSLYPRLGHSPLFAGIFLQLLGKYTNIDTTEAYYMGINQRPRQVWFEYPKQVSGLAATKRR
jgi:hypothetical protein